MFWDNKKNDELYVRSDDDNARSAYRIDADEYLDVALMVGGEQVCIDNLSATGIAFRAADSCDGVFPSEDRLFGVIFVGSCNNPIPVELDVVSRQGGLVRCRISHQDVLAQKKLTAAINRYQKFKIRASEQLRSGE